MKIILIMFLYIASAHSGVLKDDLKQSASASNANYYIHEVRLIRVIDSYEDGNITLLNDILIDVTKDKETQANNVETDTSKLPPGSHKWEVKFDSTQQSQEEINRILGIVETAAKKTGQLISKTCTTGDIVVTCNFNINIDVTNESKSKIHKREIKIQNDKPTNTEELNRVLNLVKDAENKNGVADGINCTTVDGVVICNVYLPADSADQSSSKKYKREIEYQNNTQPIDEDEVEIVVVIDEDVVVNPDTANATANTTDYVDSDTNCTTATCLFDNTSFMVGNECAPGKGRADDGTCVEELM